MALKIRPKYSDSFYNLGNLYLKMNRTNNAIECWQNSIKYIYKYLKSFIGNYSFCLINKKILCFKI